MPRKVRAFSLNGPLQSTNEFTLTKAILAE